MKKIIAPSYFVLFLSDSPIGNKSFEEVLAGVSSQCTILENEIRQSSTPRSMVASPAASVANSRPESRSLSRAAAG